MLFTPLLLVAVPPMVDPVFWEPTDDAIATQNYALDFSGGRSAWIGSLMFDELTYFSFYTLFKC